MYRHLLHLQLLCHLGFFFRCQVDFDVVAVAVAVVVVGSSVGQ